MLICKTRSNVIAQGHVINAKRLVQNASMLVGKRNGKIEPRLTRGPKKLICFAAPYPDYMSRLWRAKLPL
jgi:hypothetical protein